MSEQRSRIPVGKRCQRREPLGELFGSSDSLQAFFSFAAICQSALKPTSEVNNLVRLAICSCLCNATGR